MAPKVKESSFLKVMFFEVPSLQFDHILLVYIIQYFGTFMLPWCHGLAIHPQSDSARVRTMSMVQNIFCSFFIYVFMHELWAELS